MKRRLYLKDGVLHHPEIGRGLNGLAMCAIQYYSTRQQGDEDDDEEEEETWEDRAIALLEKSLEQYIEYKPPLSPTKQSNDQDNSNDDDDDYFTNPNHPPNHYDVSHINVNIALLHRQMGKHADAMKYYNEALRIKLLHSEDKEEEDESIVRLYLDIGDCQIYVEDYFSAKFSYEEALRIQFRMKETKDENSNNDDDEEEDDNKTTRFFSFLDSKDEDELQNMRLEQEKKRRKEEEEKLKKSTSMEGVIHHNLGRIYAHEGDYEKALSEYKQSLNIKKHIGGHSHIEVAETLNCMGAVYGTLDDLYQALTCFKEALFIFRLHSDEMDEAHDSNIMGAKKNIEMVNNALLLRRTDGDDKLG